MACSPCRKRRAVRFVPIKKREEETEVEDTETEVADTEDVVDDTTDGTEDTEEELPEMRGGS